MTMLCVLLLFAVGGFIPMTWAGEYSFEVQCAAPKTEYRLHEPIAVTFKVKNVFGRSVILHTSAAGSDSFTVLFSCTNPAIKDRASMLTFFEGLAFFGIKSKDLESRPLEWFTVRLWLWSASPAKVFLKEQLASKIDYRVAAALDYLLRAQQKANNAPLEEIERLQEHKI